MSSLLRKTAPRGKGLGVTPFSVAGNLRRAREILNAPPAEDWIRRPEPRGAVVAEFALPLELLPTTNATHTGHWSRVYKLKNALHQLMWAQAGGYQSAPLQGRPQVFCVRFSSGQPDPFSDWAKHAVDVLCVRTLKCPRRRLGFLVDDSPKHIDLYQWSENAPPGRGFCYLQVRSEEA
jgi:hypothetical protein